MCPAMVNFKKLISSNFYFLIWAAPKLEVELSYYS
jgi:hypothetical protein